jgi:hypothetical protein
MQAVNRIEPGQAGELPPSHSISRQAEAPTAPCGKYQTILQIYSVILAATSP